MKKLSLLFLALLLGGCSKNVIEYQEVLASPPEKSNFFKQLIYFKDNSSVDVTDTMIKYY